MKAAYEEQLRVHQMQKDKQHMEKIAYAQLEKDYIEYEENKRLQELARQFQRPTFLATPLHTHRRILTEPNYSPDHNPSPATPHSQLQLAPTVSRIPEVIKLFPVKMEQQ